MVLIELTCVAVIAAACGLRARGPGAREALRDAPIIGLGALVAEDSAIRLYEFYAYSPGWHLFVDRVPALIPTIWVFVVISARDVAGALVSRGRAFAVGLLVWYDASFIEPIASHAGLWAWKEPGPFGVPRIGLLGWAFFAASMQVGLTRLRGASRWVMVLVAPLATHALLLGAWWGALRWLPAGGDASGIGLVAGASAGAVAAGIGWRRVGSLPLWSITPRLPAALFFVALLSVSAPPLALVAYVAVFVPTWVLMVRWREPGPRVTAG